LRPAQSARSLLKKIKKLKKNKIRKENKTKTFPKHFSKQTNKTKEY
jgi:hypothetical protein